MKIYIKRFFMFALIFFISFSTLPIKAYADVDYEAEAEKRKKMTVESNLIENWPLGPEIGAKSAILIEANTGVVLYEKNVHEKLFPASVTKILTALVAFDNSEMNDMVTFSYDAVGSIDWRTDANMGIAGGSSITMEQTLYGMLVGSANEAAYAIAEHIAGNGKLDEFAKLMNEKAKSLGCVDSNFVTPNGIHDDNHYTSAYDLSLIGRAFFKNEFLSHIACTPKYTIPPSPTQTKGELTVYAKSKLFPGKEYAYEGLVGTKTGYTDLARQTLISCAERGNMKLICVIMMEESPNQYTDTIDLFNYGFTNFQITTVADKDTKYNISSLNSFSTEGNLFGDSKSFIEIDPKAYVVLPYGSTLEDTTSSVGYDNLDYKQVARIDYFYSDVKVGSAGVIPTGDKITKFEFTDTKDMLTYPEEEVEEDNVIFIDVFKMIIYTAIGAVFIVILIIVITVARKRYKYKQMSTASGRYEYKKPDLDWKDFD